MLGAAALQMAPLAATQVSNPPAMVSPGPVLTTSLPQARWKLPRESNFWIRSLEVSPT